MLDMTEKTSGAEKNLKITNILKKIRRIPWVRFGAGAVAALAIFALGLGIGNGRITIGASRQNSGLPSTLNFSSVNQVYQVLKQNYNGKLTSSQLLDGLKEGLAQSTGDPYTEYFN